MYLLSSVYVMLSVELFFIICSDTDSSEAVIRGYIVVTASEELTMSMDLMWSLSTVTSISTGFEESMMEAV